MSDFQLNKSKLEIKNDTEVTFIIKLSGNSNDEANFLHKFILTDRQVLMIHYASTNNSSANIKLSKTQLPKIIQWKGLLPSLLLDIVPDILSGKIKPGTIAIDLIKNIKNLSKWEKGIPLF